MSKLTPEKKEQMVFRLSATVSAVLFIIVIVLAGLQVYVRWFVNQNYTFLGGSELEALTISVFALIITITYIYRPGRSKE